MPTHHQRRRFTSPSVDARARRRQLLQFLVFPQRHTGRFEAGVLQQHMG